MIKRSDFPESFLFGVATSSYQIEGGVDERSPSIWDVFSHTPGKVCCGHTGDVAVDHYNRYEEDVKIMADLGIEAYRFSISWPRVMKDGIDFNPKGFDFYDRLVDLLLKNGIKPVVTLYHWDLPLALHEKGGWLNPDIALWFRDYAGEMFQRLGDRVEIWITLNEPWCSSFLGYFFGSHAPGHKNLQEAIEASHNLLRAHGHAVKTFRESNVKGEIGITNVTLWIEPASDSEEDVQIASLVDQAINGWFHDPVILGRYPEEYRKRLEAMGVEVKDHDMDVINERIDFLGANYYTRRIVAYDPNSPLGFRDVEGPGPKTDMGWEIYPEGLYKVLSNLYRKYGLPIYVTENGIAGPDKLIEDAVEDDYRIGFIKDHLEQLYLALKEGVDVRGYFIWSLMDNFEWERGYSKRFGLVYIDYDIDLRRIPKKSAEWLKKWLKS